MTDELLEKLRALAPWHMSVALTPDLRTIDGNGSDVAVALMNPVEMRPLLRRIYPDGLDGKRFLDCACNAGGYSFLANGLGASTFGFDVREHWIAQARFLKQHFAKTDAEVRFEVCDLLDADKLLGDEHFDICLFKGIFYHLPDPIAGLKLVADRTDELLILDTAAESGFNDGFLKLVMEGVDNPMSGVHRLAWRPTGPGVLRRVLEWLGFESVVVTAWRQHGRSERKHGRIRIVAARDASLLTTLSAPLAPTMFAPTMGEEVSGTYKLLARLPDGAIDVTKVDIRLASANGDELLGAATANYDGWNLEWDTTTVKNDTYGVYAVAFDPLGNPGDGPGTTVRVRN